MRPNKLNTKRRNISISDDDYQWLRIMGSGNASQGIRNARRFLSENKLDNGQNKH